MSYDGLLRMAELTDSSLAEIFAELQRRDAIVNARALGEQEQVDAVENLIGPDEACALLSMGKRKLYALENAGRLPFARSRSQKDRAYSKSALLKWRDRQNVA